LLIDQLLISINKTNPILVGKHLAIFYSMEGENYSQFDVEVCQPIIVDEEVKDTELNFLRKKIISIPYI